MKSEGPFFQRMRQTFEHSGPQLPPTQVPVFVVLQRYGTSQYGQLTQSGEVEVSMGAAPLRGCELDFAFASEEAYGQETARLATEATGNRNLVLNIDAQFGYRYWFQRASETLEGAKSKIRASVDPEHQDHALESVGFWLKYSSAAQLIARHMEDVIKQYVVIAGRKAKHAGEKSGSFYATIHSPGADMIYAMPGAEIITPRVGRGQVIAVAYNVDTDTRKIERLPVIVGLQTDDRLSPLLAA